MDFKFEIDQLIFILMHRGPRNIGVTKTRVRAIHHQKNRVSYIVDGYSLPVIECNVFSTYEEAAAKVDWE